MGMLAENEMFQALEIYVEDKSAFKGHIPVHIFVIQRCKHEDTDTRIHMRDFVEGLLVTLASQSEKTSGRYDVDGDLVSKDCDSQVDTFKRIGLFRMNKSATVAKFMQMHDAAEEKVITLI